ncbi:hypothetical protein BC936DRAFT_145853 [Jimgerdemannia flammicorona]|uniref:F-box/LRR-repeat protein 15-like leucin rich repeat domain-containing protein n=1 Tax=Jimgerdemannia flammicorona TaxID=994334 RepID=A0A433D938_9FUNG|nr:hypothetical protein BC936DRAFT_145853 [Jimgerdemannia flammicorona]
MPTLPLDLLRSILDYVTENQFLLATFCLVNRDWYRAAIGLLFRHPRISTRNGLMTFTKHLDPSHVDFLTSLDLSADRVREFVDNGTLQRITSVFERAAAASPPCRGRLESLTLNRCGKIMDTGLVPLLAAAGHSLLTINLEMCGNITAGSIDAIATHAPHLQSLSLYWTNRLTKRCLNLLPTGCTDLRYLDLSMCQWVVDDTVMLDICSMMSLRVLKLSSCHALTGRALAALTPALPRLEELRLAMVSESTDAEIAAMIRGCGRGMKKLVMLEATVGPDTVRAIEECLMGLELLNLRNAVGVEERMIRAWKEGGVKEVVWREEQADEEVTDEEME